MKNLHDYIAERNSNYSFRIKVAKQNPKDIMEEIKNALDAYELVDITTPKSLPVQEHREFPKWGPCECWQFEATVSYPTTGVQIAQLLKERTGMQAEWVCVYGKQQADDNDAFEAYGKDHEGSLLLDSELKDVAGAQDLVGNRRKDSLLKELTSDVVHLDNADTATLKQFFKWVSETIEHVNKSQGTGETIALPPPPAEITVVV